MLHLPSKVRVFVALGSCDMRRQAYGLAALVQAGNRNPQSGDIYVFRNRNCDIVRVLFHDQHGYCLFTKRLDRGRFKWVADRSQGSGELQITAAALGELLTYVTSRNRRI